MIFDHKSRLLIEEKGLTVKRLKSIYEEQIIFPWEDNYDQQRMLFSTQIQERPLFIIKAKSEATLITTLNLLKEYSLTIRIVGGRHSPGLQNPDIFLDISTFTKIKLDKYLRVGGGATQGQVNDFLSEYFPNYYFPGCKPNHPNTFAFPGGSAATVGVAGISTAGGIGTLRRTLGLTIDSIKGFKIIVPPKHDRGAKIITASRSKNSNLYWALLGGGAANFGIITEIWYRVSEINKVIFYNISWPWESAEEILTLWQETAPKRSNAFNEDLALFNGSDSDTSKLEIDLVGVYVIPNHQTMKEAKKIIIQELKYLGGNLTIAEASDYSQLYNRFVAARVYHNFSTARTILTLNTLPSRLIINRMEMIRNKNGSYAYIGLQLMGGKIAERSSDVTAYYPRQAKFFVDIFNFWDNPVNQEFNMKWNGKTFKKLYALNGPYSYLGFPIPHLPNHLNAYYGENKDRLIEIKHEIDPLNLLKFPGSL